MTRNVQLVHASFRERGFTLLEQLVVVARDGLGNSDSTISGSLAQPKPCRIRPTGEQAHEKDEKESRTGIRRYSSTARHAILGLTLGVPSTI